MSLIFLSFYFDQLEHYKQVFGKMSLNLDLSDCSDKSYDKIEVMHFFFKDSPKIMLCAS